MILSYHEESIKQKDVIVDKNHFLLRLGTVNKSLL